MEIKPDSSSVDPKESLVFFEKSSSEAKVEILPPSSKESPAPQIQTKGLLDAQAGDASASSETIKDLAIENAEVKEGDAEVERISGGEGGEDVPAAKRPDTLLTDGGKPAFSTAFVRHFPFLSQSPVLVYLSLSLSHFLNLFYTN